MIYTIDHLINFFFVFVIICLNGFGFDLFKIVCECSDENRVRCLFGW